MALEIKDKVKRKKKQKVKQSDQFVRFCMTEIGCGIKGKKNTKKGQRSRGMKDIYVLTHQTKQLYSLGELYFNPTFDAKKI